MSLTSNIIITRAQPATLAFILLDYEAQGKMYWAHLEEQSVRKWSEEYSVHYTAGVSLLPLPHKGAVGHFKGYFLKC